MADYHYKYLKYRSKYLNLLKGGGMDTAAVAGAGSTSSAVAGAGTAMPGEPRRGGGSTMIIEPSYFGRERVQNAIVTDELTVRHGQFPSRTVRISVPPHDPTACSNAPPSGAVRAFYLPASKVGYGRARPEDRIPAQGVSLERTGDHQWVLTLPRDPPVDPNEVHYLVPEDWMNLPGTVYQFGSDGVGSVKAKHCSRPDGEHLPAVLSPDDDAVYFGLTVDTGAVTASRKYPKYINSLRGGAGDEPLKDKKYYCDKLCGNSGPYGRTCPCSRRDRGTFTLKHRRGACGAACQGFEKCPEIYYQRKEDDDDSLY
jgi:hypothetical protein